MSKDIEHPRLTRRMVTYETPAIVERLRSEAEKHGISVGAQVRVLVRAGLGENEREPEAEATR
jgi:hypothetical protein